MYPGPKNRWWDVRYDPDDAPTEEIPVITDEMLQAQALGWKAKLKKWMKDPLYVWLAAWLGVAIVFLPISWHFSILWLMVFGMVSLAVLVIVLIPGGVQGQTELARQDTLRRRNAAYGNETDGFESYVYWGTPNPTRGR